MPASAFLTIRRIPLFICFSEKVRGGGRRRIDEKCRKPKKCQVVQVVPAQEQAPFQQRLGRRADLRQGRRRGENGGGRGRGWLVVAARQPVQGALRQKELAYGGTWLRGLAVRALHLPQLEQVQGVRRVLQIENPHEIDEHHVSVHGGQRRPRVVHEEHEDFGQERSKKER